MASKSLVAVLLAAVAAVLPGAAVAGLDVGELLPNLLVRLTAFIVAAALMRLLVSGDAELPALLAFCGAAAVSGVVLFRGDADEVGTLGAAVEGVVVFGGLATLAVLIVVTASRAKRRGWPS